VSAQLARTDSHDGRNRSRYGVVVYEWEIALLHVLTAKWFDSLTAKTIHFLTAKARRTQRKDAMKNRDIDLATL
jgi:hypothetical protein